MSEGGRVRALLAIVLFAAVLACEAAPSAASSPQAVDRLCIPMNEMQAIVAAFSSDPSRIRELARAGAAIDAAVAAGRYVANAKACRTSRAQERIQNVGSIEAAYVAAFQAAVRYRRGRSWPLGSANADPLLVDVVAMKDGRYVLLMLADNDLHVDAAGRAVLSCQGVEYYRVDPGTAAVLPFDGCVEGHARVLPALSQLPEP